MEIIRPCERCEIQRAVHKHHIFSNTKHNRKKYGAKLMDSRKNIQYLCYDCHMNKSLKKYTEQEFCEVMGIEYKEK